MAGIPYVPINYRLAAEPLRTAVMRNVPARVVVDDGDRDRVASLPGIDVCPRSALLQIAADPAAALRWGEPDAPDRAAVLLQTSGTTGDPKVAVLRHDQLSAYVFGTVDFLSAAEDECTLISTPPYHVANVAGFLSSVHAGRRIVQLESFTPEGWVELASREHVTHAMIVPTMLIRIVSVLSDHRLELPYLRHLAYGGGPMPVPVIRRALALLPQVDFVNAYGLTETSSTISVLAPEDHRLALTSSDPGVQRRLGSVGRPLPVVEVQVRNQAGEQVAAGEVGEIHVRGEQVAGSYVAGSTLAPGDWFATRDAGYFDDLGYLYVEGRLDDIIVRGGENMSPGEIEAVLCAHPAVADVGVFAVPDTEWGEAVGAAVELRPGYSANDAELQAWVRERLRSSRTPQRIWFTSELPYNETGKLLRRVLRVRCLAGEA
jgi:acyl-CoA synthetase (AMP-forming)/AMP-acid ligase II